MRILYVANYYKPAYVYGGPVRCMSMQFEALASLGAKVTVLTTNVNGTRRLDVSLAQAVPLGGVEVFYYPVTHILPRSFFYSPALAQACRQKVGQCDIAILDLLMAHSMGLSAAACTRAGVPYVIPLHGQLLPWSLRRKWLKKHLYLALLGRTHLNRAAALHCTAPTEPDNLAELGLRAPTFVVPHGIDTNHFTCLPTRGAMRNRLSIPSEATVLLLLGRLHPKKRPDLAVEALAAAQSLPGPVHLVLAGPDESGLTQALQAQARTLGCADKLHFTGLLKGDEILYALADADLLLMPSAPQSENFGMSAAEAMAAGLPILVSDGVPVGRWAEEAGAGRVVPCSAAAFTQVTLELLARPEQFKAMGRRGQALVREQFDSSAVARQMLAQYESIIATGRPLPGVT